MGDLKDEELGLLSGEMVGSVPADIAFPSKDASSKRTTPSEEASEKRTIPSVVMTVLMLMGLLAIILNLFEDHTQHMAYKSRRNSLMAPLNILVVGDWGRNGHYNQSRVARQMGIVGADLDVSFIISTGDNFYDSGLDTVDDEKFDESFSEIYTAPSLQKTWYAVLGNHDYRGNPEVQVNKRLESRDSRWFCDYTYRLPIDLGRSCNGRRRMDSTSGSVEFFFIDTNPFEEDYWTTDSKQYKWTRSTPREVVIADQLKNLTEALEASTATWKLVVGHHTMFSYGDHGNTPELIEKVLPILKANKVDLYINGHDHCLQDIKRAGSDIRFVTSGGGSKAWRGTAPSPNVKDLKLYYDGQGFISISISPTVLQVNYYDIFGTIIHQIELDK